MYTSTLPVAHRIITTFVPAIGQVVYSKHYTEGWTCTFIEQVLLLDYYPANDTLLRFTIFSGDKELGGPKYCSDLDTKDAIILAVEAKAWNAVLDLCSRATWKTLSAK